MLGPSTSAASILRVSGQQGATGIGASMGAGRCSIPRRARIYGIEDFGFALMRASPFRPSQTDMEVERKSD